MMKLNEFEDDRTRQLIKEREEYEEQFFANVVDEMMQSEAFDNMVAERFAYLENKFDLEKLENIYIIENQLINSDFINQDDLNLYDNLMDSIVNTEFEENENQFKQLIDEHIKDEKHFLDSILIEVIQMQDSFQKAIDEMILDDFKIEYEPQYFDYEPDYWYDRPSFDTLWASDEDESVKDPFDSLGDIDYPEGYVEKADPFIYERYDDFEEELEILRYDESAEQFEENPIEAESDEDLKRNLSQIEISEAIEFEDVDDKRNRQLIEEKEKIESVFKEYFAKDDTLDKIIKQKLKEKNFNH